MSETITQRITKTPGVCGGRACIAGHRIRVMDIVAWHEEEGKTPAEIVEMFPSITLSDVHSALAYYYDHADEIQQDFRDQSVAEARYRPDRDSPVERKLASARRQRGG